MGYEIFARKVRRIGSPTLCFTRSGRLAFNKAAVKILEEQAVELVLLLWDPTSRKVGIRPITKKDPRAYKVRYAPNSSGAQFSAVTFLEHIGMDYEKATRTLPAVWIPEQGIFEVALAADASDEKQPTLLAVGGGQRIQSR